MILVFCQKKIKINFQLLVLEQQSEDEAFRSVKEEKSEVVKERENITQNYERLKSTLTSRM